MLNKTIINQLLEIAQEYQGYFQYDVIGGKIRIILSIDSCKIEVWGISTAYDIINQKEISPYTHFMITINGCIKNFDDMSDLKALEWLEYIVRQTHSRESFKNALINITK